MEKNQKIKDIIYSFFKNKIPRHTELPFQHWLLTKDQEEEKNQILSQLWEDMDVSADESTYKDLKEIHGRIKYLEKKSKSLYTILLRVAVIIILPIIAFTATFFYFKSSFRDAEIVQYYVPEGETKHLILPDGTEVWINSESYLSLPRKFNSDKRIVNLTGEAYFQVAKNKLKPFVVQTNNMNIEVLGTRFNVNAYPDLTEVKTTLKEGKVKVSINNDKKTDSFILFPNEELSLNIKNGEIIKRGVDEFNMPAWSSGNLTFNAVLVSDIFKLMERKYGIKIIYNPNFEYSDRRITVKFENDENIEEVLQIFKLINPEIKFSKQDSIIRIK